MTAMPSEQVVNTKYQPIFELGRGGMAVVYLAVNRQPGGFNKLQVIKQLREELASDPDFLTMFLDEARLAARINHPNVVQTNEVGFDGQNYFLAMEYLDGQSFEALLRRGQERDGGMPQALQLRALCDALQGLHYAHDLTSFDGKPLNVVHRDISPHNIFVTYDGVAKLVDFGIAKAADSSHETRTGVLKGKVAYMAPEQFGSGTVDRRADVYAMGAVLWRILTGKRLWKGMNDMEILVQVTGGNIPSPATENPDAPPRLVEICLKALSVNADERYKTAAELQDDLEAYLASIGDHTTARELGKYVLGLFEDRRKEVQAAIEGRLAAPDPATSGDVPILWNQISGDLGSAMSGENIPSLARSSGIPVSGRQKKSSAGPLAMALVATGVFALATAVFFATRPQKRSTPVPQTIVQTVRNAGAHEQPVELKIKVSPSSATISVDDRPLQAGDQFYKDGIAHRIRVEAPGYAARAELVSFDKDLIELSFDLEKAKERDKAAAPTQWTGGGAGAKKDKDPENTGVQPAPPAGPAPPPEQPKAAEPPKGPKGPRVDRGDPFAQ